MKKVLGALGIVGACALCCAIALAIPFLGAMVVSGTGFAMGWDVALCAGVLLLGVGGLLMWNRRSAREKANGCAANGCGVHGKQCGS